jgi:hypothetical protein
MSPSPDKQRLTFRIGVVVEARIDQTVPFQLPSIRLLPMNPVRSGFDRS